MSEWTASQIRELIDVQICAERRHRDALRVEDRRSFDYSVAAVEKALLLQAAEYERRLTDLNHAHAQAKDALATYIPREVFERYSRESVEWQRKAELRMADLEQRIKATEMGLVNLPGGMRSLEIGLASKVGERTGSAMTRSTMITIISIGIAMVAAIVGLLAYFGK